MAVPASPLSKRHVSTDPADGNLNDGMRALQDGSAQAQTDLVLNMEEGEQLTGSIEYATELFLPATAERMARHMEVTPSYRILSEKSRCTPTVLP